VRYWQFAEDSVWLPFFEPVCRRADGQQFHPELWNVDNENRAVRDSFRKRYSFRI
jgi:hypothetical protein